MGHRVKRKRSAAYASWLRRAKEVRGQRRDVGGWRQRIEDRRHPPTPRLRRGKEAEDRRQKEIREQKTEDNCGFEGLTIVD
jgi:hypothetical protein